MMGLYLPNMEMPKEGSWTTVRIYPDGTCAAPNWQGDCTLIKDTKAVPVPPHGRLIDASEKIRVLIYDDMTEDFHMVDMTIDDLLSQGWVEAAAPTIIPAEPVSNSYKSPCDGLANTPIPRNDGLYNILAGEGE